MIKKYSKYENKETVKKLIQLGKAFCIIGTSIPLLILIMRFVDYDFLLKITPGKFTMNPITSVCYIFIGISIWLVRTEETMQKHLLTARLLCIITIIYCISVLILDFTLRIKFEPDETLIRALFKNPQEYGLNLNYKSMVINNALGMCLISLSIICINHKNAKLYASSETLNYLIIWGSFLIIYGHLYSLENIYASFGRVPMAFYSAVTLLLLSSAVILIRPHRGTMEFLIGENPTEVFVMRFLAFFIPLIIGYIKIQGVQNDLFNDDIGTALLAISTYIISMTILGWKSTVQYKLQIAQKQRNNIIKKDREKMERILNTSQAYIQILDIEKDRIIFSNESGEGSFTLGKEIENRKYSEIIKKIIHPDDLHIYTEGIKRAHNLKDDEYDDIEFRVVDRQNNSIWLFSRAMVYQRKNGKVTQVIYNALDITQEKQKEEELIKRKTDLEKSKNELEKAEQKLKEANEILEEQAEKHAEEIFRSEKKYHNYIENSFAGIIQHEQTEGGINTNLPIKEQIKLIKERTVIKEVNKSAAEIHGFSDPNDMKNMKLMDFLKFPEKDLDILLEQFIKNDYKIIGVEPIEFKKNGNSVKVYENSFGIVKDNRLVKIWEIETSSKIES